MSHDFLRPELRIAGHAGELFDMNRGEAIFLHDTLGDEDGILEVVTFQGMNANEQVLPERQLAEVVDGPSANTFAARNHVTRIDQRTLIDTSVLIEACTSSGCRYRRQVLRPSSRYRSHERRCEKRRPNQRFRRAGDHRHTRVNGNRPFHARTDERNFGAQRWHGLALHVRTHQSAVWHRHAPGTESATQRPKRSASG